jgi:hypothetical protein
MGEGLSPKAWSRLIERKTRLMNAGPSMKPRKAQVKDKGLGAESGDMSIKTTESRLFRVKIVVYSSSLAASIISQKAELKPLLSKFIQTIC